MAGTVAGATSRVTVSDVGPGTNRATKVEAADSHHTIWRTSLGVEASASVAWLRLSAPSTDVATHSTRAARSSMRCVGSAAGEWDLGIPRVCPRDRRPATLGFAHDTSGWNDLNIVLTGRRHP